jgi:hypothetical protein
VDAALYGEPAAAPVATDVDGQTIYFAQAERAIEAGLSFTF